jgi:tetratricopeptide (TPR) repeat protein
LAALNHALGNNRGTIEELRTALRLEPYLSGVRDDLAKAIDREGGRPDEVRRLREEEVALLERDSRLLPTNDAVQYRRGMVLYLLGKHDDARLALQKACELAPNSFDNWMALALICEQQRRWQEGVAALKRMRDIRPNDPVIGGIFQRLQQSVKREQQEPAGKE